MGAGKYLAPTILLSWIASIASDKNAYDQNRL